MDARTWAWEAKRGKGLNGQDLELRKRPLFPWGQDERGVGEQLGNVVVSPFEVMKCFGTR